MLVNTHRRWQTPDQPWIKQHSLSVVLVILMTAQTSLALWSGAFNWSREQPFGPPDLPTWGYEFWGWWIWEYNISLVADTFGVLLIVMLSKWLYEADSAESDDPPEGVRAVLTIEQMKGVLTKVTYRPGWTFQIIEEQFEGPYLRILAPVENSYQPGTNIDLGINSPLPPFRNEQEFLDWILWRLQRVESHEGREWFRYEGSLVSDPHAVNA